MGILFGCYTGLTYQAFPAAHPDYVDTWMRLFSIAGLKERIVGVYAYPHVLMDVDPQGTSLFRQYLVTNQNVKYVQLEVDKPTSLDGYTPKNNKLFTYPYTFCRLSSFTESRDYLFEKFTDPITGNPSDPFYFYIFGTFIPEPSVLCVPTNYDHLLLNFEQTLTIKYPQLPAVSDSFLSLVGNNGIASKLLPLGTVITGAMTGSLGAALAGAVSSADKMLSDSVNNFIVTGADSDTMTSLNRDLGTKTIAAYTISIRAQNARRIDDFLSMYGYATEKVKVPNTSGRRSWNYVKTKGARIGGNIPGSVADKICAILDRGITFWHPSATIGDYTQNNDIISVG